MEYYLQDGYFLGIKDSLLTPRYIDKEKNLNFFQVGFFGVLLISINQTLIKQTAKQKPETMKRKNENVSQK